MPDDISGDVVAAWSDFCDGLKAAGLDGVRQYTDGSDGAASDMLLYVTKLLRAGLDWRLDAADPQHPRLTWYDRCAGGAAPLGPNLDNSYLLGRVDDRFTYRLSLDASAIDEVNISVHTGSPIDGDYAVYGDLTLADFDIAEGGAAQILFSRRPQNGAHFVMPQGADYLFIRFYYFDWERTSPPAVFLDCLDPQGVQPIRPGPKDLIEGLAGAAHWVRGTLGFAPLFINGFLGGREHNAISEPRGVPGGGGAIQYGGSHFAIGPNEALVISFTPPKARYWSVQWQQLPWGEPIDVMRHLISLNHTQAEVGSDGRVQMILSERDPGVRNWLDTGGSREGFLMYRWIWSQDSPTPEATVMPFAQAKARLELGYAAFGPQDRAAQMAVRRAHLTKRY